MTFWEALKVSLVPQYSVLKFYFFCCLHPSQYLEFLALLLAYLMPVFVMAIRWKSSFGDHSQIGMALTSFLFHLVCAAFLVLCVWMAFDPPFSPRHLESWDAVLDTLLSRRIEHRLFQRIFFAHFWQRPQQPIAIAKAAGRFNS